MANKTVKRDAMPKGFIRKALSKIAMDVVRASEKGAGAGDEVLYRLPGVFSMSIRYHEECVRLIKEANAFRIMEKSEKSEESLSIQVMDLAALKGLNDHDVTWQKLYAEGRMVFSGKEKYVAALIRVAAAGDALLSAKKYRKLYGE